MKMTPLLRCEDMSEAIRFYTTVLDFRLREPEASADDWVVDLVRGEAEIMLTRLASDQVAGIAVVVVVDDVDGLFATWTGRGLDQSHRAESPVHLGPLEQTWGTREAYVTDPFGNTLRLVQRPA